MTTTQDKQRPNILFILGDDWGWGDLGCFGHPIAATPHLDQLAAAGSRFTQFYVAAPVCSPSRAAFTTGLFPARVGFHHICGAHDANQLRGMPDYLDPSYPTISSLLRDGGYRTGHVGKWHLGQEPDVPTPGDYGFDVHRSTNSSGPDLRDDFYEPAGAAQRHYAQPELDIAFRPHSSRLIVDRAIEFLSVPDERPFFLQLWLLDPHATLNPTETQMEPYRHLSPHGVGYPGAPTVYYSVLTEADRQLGRLLAALAGAGLAENTIVVFTGDNGPEEPYAPNASHSAVGSSGPFRGRKRSLYEGGVRMPLIVRWPGHLSPGTVDNTSVLSGVDLLPTLCAAAGVEAPRTDGEDCRAALESKEWSRQNPLFWEYRFANASHPMHCSPMLAMRRENWKLLINPDGSRVELYDIPIDPMEMKNLAEQYPDLVDEMSEQLLRWADELPPGPRSAEAGSSEYPWPRHSTEPLATRGAWESGW